MIDLNPKALDAAAQKAYERGYEPGEREAWDAYAQRRPQVAQAFRDGIERVVSDYLAALDRDPLAEAAQAATMVAEFIGHPNSVQLSDEVMLRLHQEEHEELQQELGRNGVPIRRDLLARELADVVYLAYYSAHEHGIDLDLALDEVHRAAMDKMEANVRRADGKIVKPPGFVPPNMTAALTGRDKGLSPWTEGTRSGEARG